MSNNDKALRLSRQFSASKSDYSSLPLPSLLLTFKVTRFFLPRPPLLASHTPKKTHEGTYAATAEKTSTLRRAPAASAERAQPDEVKVI